MLMRVVLDDGTGAISADLHSTCIERILGGNLSAEQFDAMSGDDREKQSEWLRQFLLGFLGKVYVYFGEEKGCSFSRVLRCKALIIFLGCLCVLLTLFSSRSSFRRGRRPTSPTQIASIIYLSVYFCISLNFF